MVMLLQKEDETKQQSNNSIQIYTDQHEPRKNPWTSIKFSRESKYFFVSKHPSDPHVRIIMNISLIRWKKRQDCTLL